MKQKAKQGKVLGGRCASIGLVYDKEMATLKECPETAKIVKLAFYLFANENVSLTGLASRFNNLHIPTPKGGDRWRASTLGAMLRNEVYVGSLHLFRKYRVEPKYKNKMWTKSRKTSNAYRPREEWVTVSVPPLISADLFEAVQRKLRRNAELARRNTKRDYLLSGLLYCSECGGRLGGHVISGVPAYICYRSNNRNSIPLNAEGKPVPCRLPVVKAEFIEPVVWETVAELIKDPDSLLEELRQRGNRTSDTREMLERELQLCESRLKAIPTERKRLVEGYRKGLYADFMMREDMELLQKEENELEARKTDVQRQLAQNELTASQEVRIKSLMQQLNAGLRNLDFHGRQEVVRLLVERVVYNVQSIQIQTIIPTNPQLHPIHLGGE